MKTLRIIHNVAYLTLALSGVVLIAFFLVPRISGWGVVTILSGSMNPALQVGGIAIVQPANATEVQVGDIILFQNERKTKDIVHRVIAIEEDGSKFRTKGDAAKYPDERPVSSSQIRGIVHFHMPYLGYLAAFLRTTWGLALFIGVPAALLFWEELRNIIRHTKPITSREGPAQE